MNGLSSKRTLSVNLSKQRRDTLSKLLVDDLQGTTVTQVREWLQECGLQLVELLLNAEVLELAGERHERKTSKDCVRWGEQDGSVLLMEQRVPLKKPRVRTKDGKYEVILETYEKLNQRDFLNEQATAKLLSGVSTRRFPKTLEQMLDGGGTSRQVISQRGMEEMSKQLEEFRTRDLAGVDILAVFIDGIGLGDDVFVAAVGIDSQGKKHVLDFEQGSTESSGVCRALLGNLIERGILQEAGGYLFVVDGGKGLKKAIKEVFGRPAQIQRCTIHKRRNIEEKLPKKMHGWLRQQYNAALNKKSYNDALHAFSNLRGQLILARRQAAADSLTEGMPELLTLHKLELGPALKRSLSTTNCIESLFSAARYYTRNVKRWRNEEQMRRWIATGLLEAEKNFRRIPGYTNIKQLKQKLRG